MILSEEAKGCDEKTKTKKPTKISIQLEDINQNILTKRKIERQGQAIQSKHNFPN